MSADQLVARGRIAAERLMVDTVTIDRPDGTTTYDDVTKRETKNYDDPYYTGKARLQQQAAVGLEDQGGGRTVTTLRLELQLPITVTGTRVDDRVTVDAAPNDPDLVGRTFRIQALHHKTHATARRVSVEEVLT